MCQENAPVVNRLYNFIQEAPSLARDIKVLAIAVGDSKTRVDAFKAKFKVPFPIFPDEKMEIHTFLKRPMVPSTVLTTSDGKVLMNHNGKIDDFDELAKRIREIHKEY